MSNTLSQLAFDAVELPVANVQAIQTTRISPVAECVSLPPFNNFNLGLHVGDDSTQVLKNRDLLLSYLPTQAKIQWLEQVHGADVVKIVTHSDAPITADAVITQTAKLALAVMTADCLPILLTSKKGDEIAAIHGGWRPLAAGIIHNTLDKMKTANKDIIAWLGPCIGKEAFEVGEEVRQAFLDSSNTDTNAFIANSNNKWLADLTYISIQMLASRGVETIVNGHYCTVSHSQRYYSYRKEQTTGRMASLICIN